MFMSFPHFFLVVCFSGVELYILYIIQMSWLCVLEINPLSVVSFAIFSPILRVVFSPCLTLMAEREEGLKSLLMKVKVESGKSWLKTQRSEN